MKENMKSNSNWPMVVGTLSVFYGLMRVLTLHRLTQSLSFTLLLNCAIVVTMFTGAFGLILRKEWGRKTLFLAGGLAVCQGINSLITVFIGFDGIPPLFAMLGLMTAVCIYNGWPVFLIIWLWKHNLKNNIYSKQPEDILRADEC